jgi:hypothetical protein
MAGPAFRGLGVKQQDVLVLHCAPLDGPIAQRMHGSKALGSVVEGQLQVCRDLAFSRVLALVLALVVGLLLSLLLSVVIVARLLLVPGMHGEENGAVIPPFDDVPDAVHHSLCVGLSDAP